MRGGDYLLGKGKGYECPCHWALGDLFAKIDEKERAAGALVRARTCSNKL